MVERQKNVTSCIGGTREIAANVYKTSSSGLGDLKSGSSAFMAQNNFRGKKDLRRNLKRPGFVIIVGDLYTVLTNALSSLVIMTGMRGLEINSRDNSFKTKKPVGAVKMAANVVNFDGIQDSPLEEIDTDEEVHSAGQVDGNLIQALAQEVLKFMRCKQGVDHSSGGFAPFAYFAGNNCSGA